MKLLKDPAEYAQQIYDSYLTPSASFITIIIELSRLRPQLHEEYIEAVAKELKKIIDAN